MGRLRILLRPRADVLLLEASAERAGAALACSFASSDEFEAAIIRARRAAGIYGPKRRRRRFTGLATATALIALLFLIV
jgi:hypothetical protein